MPSGTLNTICIALMTTSTQAITDRRILRSQQRRAEEQVVAAVLHASSLLGFIAIIASAAVWSNQRIRSRFLAIQARQAMLFQIVTAIGLLITFILFMAGFYTALFSGLIARTGVSEPELTSALILAAVVGGTTLVFFLILLPLTGVWAAIRILRGHNFRYPLLGRLVVNWYNQKYDTSMTALSPSIPSFNTSEPDTTVAGIAHLGILAGFGPVVAAVLWATTPQHSLKLTFNLMQAALFQMCLMAVIFIGFCAFPASAILILPLGLLSIVAAIRAFAGREVRYPVLGNWLARYLRLEANDTA